MSEKPNIIVIEDDPDLRLLMASMLKLDGYRTDMCLQVNSSFAYVVEKQPDLIVMDMLLSGIDGRDLCRQFRQNESTKSLKIVMVSAHPDAKEQCKQAGADDFVFKPFDLDNFLEVVRNVLAKA